MRLATFCLFLAACAPLRPLRARDDAVQTEVGEFVLDFAEWDPGLRPALLRAIGKAAPVLARWGRLRAPVHVTVFQSHWELEEAADRHGFPWLRAWARWGQVLLQSPRSWNGIPPRTGPGGPPEDDPLTLPVRAQLADLLEHELTHCLMFQLAGDRRLWRSQSFPFWFREGMASYTAGQGYRWPPLEILSRHDLIHPREDLIYEADFLSRAESDLVYGTAHHAFTFLVERYGESSVRTLLGAMSRGATFEDAFRSAVGIPVTAFVNDFQNYVRWKGYRPASSRGAIRPARGGILEQRRAILPLHHPL